MHPDQMLSALQPLTDLLLSLSQSLNAAFEILHELNARRIPIQPQQDDLEAIITAHRMSTLEAIRALKSRDFVAIETGGGRPVSQSTDQVSRLEELVAAEVARSQDEINDEIGRLKSHVLRTDQARSPPTANDVVELRRRMEQAFAMLDKKADIFEMEKKANLSDMEKLLAMFLSGDQILAGKTSLRSWKCISCDRRLLSISKEAGGKDPGPNSTAHLSRKPRLSYNRSMMLPLLDTRRQVQIQPKTMFDKSYSCIQLTRARVQ